MTIGILGGMGPKATICCMEQVLAMTKAAKDQENIPLLVYSCPSIPDRTAYILDHSKEDPRPALIAGVRALSAQGVGCIGIACVTSHYFYKDIQASVDTPVINMVDETVSCLALKGYRKIGLMATRGTLATGLFDRALKDSGMDPVVPGDGCQKLLMEIIYDDVKAGRQADMAKFRLVTEDLRAHGAEVIVLGCTELSVIKREHALGAGYLDALECLSRRLVLSSGHPLRDEYRDLLQTGHPMSDSPDPMYTLPERRRVRQDKSKTSKRIIYR